MTRVFPSITVEGIDTKDSVMARGDRIERMEDITPDIIQDILGERDVLIYTLKIKASANTLAKAKARSFVRAKNPFEPRTIDIVQAKKVRDGDRLLNDYSVRVGVKK